MFTHKKDVADYLDKNISLIRTAKSIDNNQICLLENVYKRFKEQCNDSTLDFSTSKIFY